LASYFAYFKPRDNRVAIITFSQNPFLFRENKIKIGKKKHSDLFNLNTKIPIYFKNKKIVVCLGQTNDTSDTGLRNFMSLLVALKVAKNKGAEICGLNLG
jgi:hypothetical protein